MKFIFGGENGWAWLERMAYDGAIGLFYKDTLSGVISYIIFFALVIFAVIGFLAVLKWIFFGRKPKEDPGKKWLRTGKF